MIVNSMIFKVASLGLTAALIAQPDSQQLGIWAVFATSLAAVVTNWVNRRADAQEREQRHLWEIEARERQAAQIREDIARNTAITQQAANKADQAFDAANHVNEKIAAIARGDLPKS